MEVWKDIPGFDGHYEVSNEGRVRSKKRVVIRANSSPLSVQERILKPVVGNHGYEVVQLSLNGLAKPHTVHSLVALAFIGPRPPGHDVCHADGGRRNNLVTNLRYGTRLENVHDAQRHGTHIKGEKVGNSRLNRRQVEEIKRRAIDGESVMCLATEFAISHTHVIGIRDGKRWKHV